MRQFSIQSVQRETLICDRCGEEIGSNRAVRFGFIAGYGSVFGDGNRIEGDFCQVCIEQVFGGQLRTAPVDPLRATFPSPAIRRSMLDPYRDGLDAAEALIGLLRDALALHPDSDSGADATAESATPTGAFDAGFHNG
jgi:hypothetical protein